MTKRATPRDGWSGRAFRKLRIARQRSRSWVSTKTFVTEQSVSHYELDRTFPSHRWRDLAARALNVSRELLGLPEAIR